MYETLLVDIYKPVVAEIDKSSFRNTSLPSAFGVIYNLVVQSCFITDVHN
jgi:hypothetical protein